MSNFESRAVGALLGLAIGDALGAPVEFYQRGRFEPLTTMRSGGKFKMQLGEWTDDTAMALCLADSLIACKGSDPKDQMERYWRWGNEGYNSTRSHAFGVGKTVAKALGLYNRSGDPFSGSTNPKTAGNGSIMRLAPVVLYYVDDYDTALNEAERSSRTTHQATEALFACRYLAHILYRCIYLNVDKASITAEFKETAPTETLQALLDKTYRDKTANEISSSGYVVACLEAALWAFEQTDTFESALLLAANLGDDSDTVAAVCGQIAGAYYGEQAIPSHWLAVLFERERIEAIAKQLIGARSYI